MASEGRVEPVRASFLMILLVMGVVWVPIPNTECNDATHNCCPAPIIGNGKIDPVPHYWDDCLGWDRLDVEEIL